MSDVTATDPVKGGPTETKTWAATVASYVLSFLGLVLVSSNDSDLVNSLPDWLETPVYAALAALGTYLAGRYTSHKAGKLSLSAIRAARQTR